MIVRDDSLGCALRSFASSSVATGGGGAAALTGALGVALLCMVSRQGLRRAQADDQTGSFGDLLKRGLAYQHDLENLMERDPLAYKRVAVATRALKRDPRTRLELIDAFKEATRVPLQIAKAAHGGLRVAAELVGLDVGPTLTEVGTGAYLCHAAVQSALCTALANLKEVADPKFGAEACAGLSGLVDAGEMLQRVSARVAERTGMNETLSRVWPAAFIGPND